MLKKFFIILISILLMIGMCGNVNATELKTSLDIIQKASETKYLENDQGFISKTIVDSNSDTGEVTIELKLSNTTKEVETNGKTEIFIVIDDSGSMEFETENGTRRKNLVIDSTITLITNILNNTNNCSIGLVKFSGPSTKYGTGSASNASLLSKLDSNKDSLVNTLQNFKTKTAVNGTNIESGMKLAKDNFSTDCKNKIILLITDGLPDSDLHGNTTYNNNQDEIQRLINNTKACLSDSDTNVISLLTGLSNSAEDYNEENQTRINEIFGTTTNPTADKFYYISDSNIQKIITEDIYTNVMEKVQNPINTTKIVDYFPEDITDNFDFSYVGSPSIGTASDSIDTESKTITWDIGTLKGDEVATLKYKLKIKDMKNTDLLNKTIATNEKVVLTYKDTESKDYTVELTGSPKIQLSEVKEELIATVSYDPTTNTTGNVVATIKTNKKVNKVDGWTLSDDGKTLTKTYSTNATETVHLVDLDGMTKDVEIKITNITSVASKQDNEKDTTTAKGTLPQTGVNMAVSIASIIAIILVALVLYKKYNSYKDIK